MINTFICVSGHTYLVYMLIQPTLYGYGGVYRTTLRAKCGGFKVQKFTGTVFSCIDSVSFLQRRNSQRPLQQTYLPVQFGSLQFLSSYCEWVIIFYGLRWQKQCNIQGNCKFSDYIIQLEANIDGFRDFFAYAICIGACFILQVIKANLSELIHGRVSLKRQIPNIVHVYKQ